MCRSDPAGAGAVGTRPPVPNSSELWPEPHQNFYADPESRQQEKLSNNGLPNSVQTRFSCLISNNVVGPLYLKGQCHEIFDPKFFFHQSTPPVALIHGLKPFCIWPRIRREKWQYLKLPEFFWRNFSSEIMKFGTIQIFNSEFQWGHWISWNNFSGVIDHDAARSLSPLKFIWPG
jgi:hypothetical protein